MITYGNTSKLLFSQSTDNDVMNLKSKASQAKAGTEFKSVFDSITNDRANSSNSSNISKSSNSSASEIDSTSTSKYKSYNDLKANKTASSEQTSVGKSAGDAKVKDIDAETEKADNDSGKYDESINVLAQMLGMQPDELIKLASELGFSAEDLQDIKNVNLFMDKLANVLELNDSQKTMLSSLAKEVLKQVNAEAGSEVASTLESTKTASKETTDSNNIKAIDLTEIADEVKSKLNQLIENAKVDSESVGSEISKVIAAMKSQAQAKVITSVSVTDDVPNTEQLSVEENIANVKESTKSENSKKENNSGNSNESKSDTKEAVKSVNVSAQSSIGNDQNIQLDQQNGQAIADVKVSILNNPVAVEKSVFSMPQTVKSSEVINQVVEQAKVVIGQDKSEMIIQMKPDHLGKLELKVVTEQGIVAAKFIAESQQVKEIIETNMQLLKDSLQKQGISIDSVSVQVGNDKQSEYQQQNSYQNQNSSSSRTKYGMNGSGITKVGINAFDTLPERLAQYAYESNTINLTA